MTKIVTTLVTGMQYTQAYAAEVKASVNVLYDQAGSTFKTYLAFLSQTGTSTPTATVKGNNLGFDPIYNYATVGTYQILLTGTISPANIDVLLRQKGTASKRVQIDYFLGTAGSNTLVTIRTYNASNSSLENDILGNTPIEIRVYE